MSKTETITQRVHTMAAVLDFVQPDWFEKIDLDTFDMSCVSSDLSAQLGEPMHMIYDEDALRFLVTCGLVAGIEDEYTDITKAWEIQVKDRLQHEKKALAGG